MNLYLASIRFAKKVPALRRLLLGAARLVRPIEPTEYVPEEDFIDCELAPEEIVMRLRRDGLAEGLRLPDDVVEEITAFAESAVCYADRDGSKPFLVSEYSDACEKYGKSILVGQYFNTMGACSAIGRLGRSQTLKRIADQYLGVRSRLLGVNLWWTFVSEPSQDDIKRHAHQFHYDIDDIQFVKFFFYLTDVSEEDGPHVMVLGSHRDDAFRRSLLSSPRLTDEWVEEHFHGKIKSLVGSKGVGLAEDTYVIHKGTVPRATNRLMLQIEYGVFGNTLQSDVR